MGISPSERRWRRQLRRCDICVAAISRSTSYPGAQHEVLNEINKEEVLHDVARFLRGALGLRPSS